MKTEPKPRSLDGRNIADKYFFMSNEAIKEDLDSKRFNYSILCCNIVGDFNISSVVRSSNAFLAKEVIVYGKKRFDNRGAVGTQHYTNFRYVRFVEDLDDVFKEFDVVIGFDNIPSAHNVADFKYDPNKKYLFCFGEEREGLHDTVLNRCHERLYIEQLGSVRSLNVSSCASIVMFDYINKVRNVKS